MLRAETHREPLYNFTLYTVAGLSCHDIIRHIEPIQIRAFDKPLDIRLVNYKIVLPSELQTRVTAHWQVLLQQNPALQNGEVFTVVSVEENSEKISIRLAETDYAHYLYSRQFNDLGEYTVRIIHPAALVLAGNKIIFGSMASHTSLAGTIQCCGGGIDRNAVGSDGVVAIDRTIIAELKEELGIEKDDARVASILPTYLKFGGPTGKMTLVYIVKLKPTSKQFLKDYTAFAEALQKRGEEPEFDQIFCIDNDEPTIEAFIQEHTGRLNEYMPVLLRTASKN